MIEFTFTNSRGEVVIGGAGAAWRLVKAEGLGLAPRSFSTAVYPGMPGQELTAESVGARTITLSADLRMNRETQRRLSQAAIILDQAGSLVLRAGYKHRKIGARCQAFELGARNGAFVRCVFQFMCDYPYFSDVETTYVPVFQRKGLLDNGPAGGGTFSFPGMFSRRISRGEIVSPGSAYTEPVFTIDVQFAPENTSAAEKGLRITNETTGQYIRLDYEPATGEQIRIDIPNRKIENSQGVSLIEYISDDTFLDGFYIVPGSNIIEALNYSVETSLTVLCAFTNKYVEALY